MGAPIVHFEIMGGEGSELEAFYRELFGWKINSNNPMKYGVVETRTGRHQWWRWVRPRTEASAFPYMRGWKTCRERLIAERFGGKTILPPSEVPGGPKLAMFADPAGNITGLFQGK